MYNIHLVVGHCFFPISLQRGNIILLSSLNVYLVEQLSFVIRTV